MGIAQFGRALNFGKAAGVPIWGRGDGDTFPSALGWADVFLNVSEQPAAPEYRGPFLDFTAVFPELAYLSPVLSTIGLSGRVVTKISRSGPVVGVIDRNE